MRLRCPMSAWLPPLDFGGPDRPPVNHFHEAHSIAVDWRIEFLTSMAAGQCAICVRGIGMTRICVPSSLPDI
jgi:hypothetical protein